MATSGNYKKVVSLQRQRNFVITIILVGIIKLLKSKKYFFFFIDSNVYHRVCFSGHERKFQTLVSYLSNRKVNSKLIR